MVTLTCIYVMVTNGIKINLCCVRLSKCGVFGNKHKWMASTKITVVTNYELQTGHGHLAQENKYCTKYHS